MTVSWKLWQEGTRLPGSERMAFDTETVAVDLNKEVPPGVLLTAWAGEGDVVVVPTRQWAKFVKLHLDRHWVGHNVAFDFHVVLKVIQEDTSLREAWVRLVDRNRMGCTQLLDGLVRIASGESDLGKEKDSKKPMRNLENLSIAYQIDCAPPDKASPYRKRFGELLGEPDWLAPHVDQGFFQYACVDTKATYLLAEKLYARAWELHNNIDKEFLHPRADEWGPLTSAIQVQASVALAEVSRRGFHVDVEGAWRLESRLRNEYQEHVTWLDLNCPGIIQKVSLTSRTKRKGSRRLSARTGCVSFSAKRLRVVLSEIAEDLGVEAPVSDGKQRWISTSVDDWAHLADKSEFLRHWTRAMELTKQFAFLATFRNLDPKDPAIRSRYITIVRTGRTASQAINIQQIPRLKEFRSLFHARPGKKLYITDYSFIELRTLSYLTEKWQGRSEMGRAIREGKDPHTHTASLMLHKEYPEVKAQLKAEKDPGYSGEKWASHARQSAKAVNFGTPGGLGAERLVAYAKANYGVDLTMEQAKGFRETLITRIYPELNKETGWLSTRPVEDLARNLSLDPDRAFELCLTFDPVFSRLGICMDRVLRGCAVKADGTPYNPAYVERLWNFARYLLSHSPTHRHLCPLFDTYQPSDELADLFFQQAALTPTGRIRRGIGYTDSRNCPFQSLAADGAKRALWSLWKKGIEVVAFIHDEIVAEVEDESQGKVIEEEMIKGMEEVLEGFPVAVEGTLSDVWTK